ncbi:MAG TPA: GFA family protein [Methylomirabilota bacterium]|nr:GFA family protein [Methylomirabilota bacterium]
MTRLTGGCQCGAVRFSVEETGPRRASICHCRMCQKAFGAFYAPLVSVDPAALTWTRGEPKRWRSSNHVSRGFCAACGTPLTYEPDTEWPALAIGAFDRPELVPPTKQFGLEGELSYVATLHTLPRKTTEETVEAAAFLADLRSHQHPDQETDTWPEGQS